MQNSSAVPYQAYRSKRHSRPASLPISPNVRPPSLPPADRPLSADWNAEKRTPVLDIDPPPPAPNGRHREPDPEAPPAAPKKPSTFRRLRPSAPLPSSPLRPPEAHSRVPSFSSSIARQLDSTPPRVPSISSATSDDRPPVLSLPVPPRATSSPPVSSPPVSSPPVSSPPLPHPAARSSAPYRPGFQPRGVIRIHTDEFSQLRKSKHDASRIERTKLERRLEKLIHLHFPIQPVESPDTKMPTLDRRRSTIFDLDLDRLRNMGAGDVWRGVIQSQAFQGAKGDIRAAEQRIAPWQQDAAVSKCPLCSASFHPITNRRHHCRLCGQIICSLPLKRPQRPEPCSILFIVDSKTRQIEEVGEGVDYGVKRRATGPPTRKGNGNEKEDTEALADEEKFLKGVRICRSCKPVLSREQFYQGVSRISPLAKLYDTFIITERDIEEALPQFQELLLTLNSDSPPTKEATATRKCILDSFASYDALSKRIRQIPCPPGSSQDRVQLAIRARAELFLQKNMFPLQSLPKPKKPTSSPDAVPPVDPDSELAHALQPLLEQEALLESFVSEATGQRKFEDAKTLRANLKEIRVEIDRILENQVESGA